MSRAAGLGVSTGVILPFGRIAGDRRELFTPGSVTIPDGGIALSWLSIAAAKSCGLSLWSGTASSGLTQRSRTRRSDAPWRTTCEPVDAPRLCEFHALADAMVQPSARFARRS